MNLKRIAVPALSLMLVGAALAVAGCGAQYQSNADAAGAAQTMKTGLAEATDQTGAAGTPGNTLDATLTDYKINTPTTQVKAGKVTLSAVNKGTVVHEMVVLKTDKPADKLGNQSKISEKDSVGEISELKPNQKSKVTLDLKPGKYVLVCNVAGHYMMGMYKPLTVV